MFCEKSKTLTNIHRSSGHTDISLSETPTIRIINTVQASGCYRGVPCAPGLGEVSGNRRDSRAGAPSSLFLRSPADHPQRSQGPFEQLVQSA